MSGQRTVEQVEVSTDGGLNWHKAKLGNDSLPDVWITWVYEWPLPEAGTYEIVARATDSAQMTQPAQDIGLDVYDGRTGWHRVPVNVVNTS
jgi:hypothetical protein